MIFSSCLGALVAEEKKVYHNKHKIDFQDFNLEPFNLDIKKGGIHAGRKDGIV